MWADVLIVVSNLKICIQYLYTTNDGNTSTCSSSCPNPHVQLSTSINTVKHYVLIIIIIIIKTLSPVLKTIHYVYIGVYTVVVSSQSLALCSVMMMVMSYCN